VLNLQWEIQGMIGNRTYILFLWNICIILMMFFWYKIDRIVKMNLVLLGI